MSTLKEKVFGKITADFQVLSKIVLQQINLIGQLLENNRDENLITGIGQNEHIIDGLEVKIRDEVIRTIVLYSPRATNLRMIISYYDMTAYLERIGDLILNIAGFLQKTDIRGPLFVRHKEGLTKMLRLAERMTQNAIFAFTCEDIRLARETIRLDDQVDRLYHSAGEQLPGICAEQQRTAGEIADALGIAGIAGNIERIGDNATNIAEAAIYLIEGKNIRHSGIPEEEN